MICALLALPLPLRAVGRIPVLHVGIVLGSCFSRFSFFFGADFLEFAFGMGGRRRRSGGVMVCVCRWQSISWAGVYCLAW